MSVDTNLKTHSEETLNDLKVKELQEVAKANSITGYSDKKKTKLVNLLLEYKAGLSEAELTDAPAPKATKAAKPPKADKNAGVRVVKAGTPVRIGDCREKLVLAEDARVAFDGVESQWVGHLVVAGGPILQRHKDTLDRSYDGLGVEISEE